MRLDSTGRLLLVLLFAPSVLGAVEPRAERPLSEQAYAGLVCRDHHESGGMLVGWVMPGPLQGKAFTSPFLNRGDIIVAVNGKPMGKMAWRELLERAEPGDALKLRVRATQGREGTAVSEPVRRDDRLLLLRTPEWPDACAWEA
jgi:hypothetical protein